MDFFHWFRILKMVHQNHVHLDLLSFFWWPLQFRAWFECLLCLILILSLTLFPRDRGGLSSSVSSSSYCSSNQSWMILKSAPSCRFWRKFWLLSICICSSTGCIPCVGVYVLICVLWPLSCSCSFGTNGGRTLKQQEKVPCTSETSGDFFGSRIWSRCGWRWWGARHIPPRIWSRRGS